MTDAALAKLAAAHGIAPQWHDLAGQEHGVSPETQRALLAAMGVSAATEAETVEALKAHRAAEQARRLPREVVATAGTDLVVPVPVATEWRLDCEDGETLSGRADEAIRLNPRTGVHRLTVGQEACLVIAAPTQAPDVGELTGRARIWGATAPLYGLRSARNLGVGDYADLAAAAQAFGALGADFLGVNPIHAKGAATTDISPYSPSSRIAYNSGLIAVDHVAGVERCEPARLILATNDAALRAARAAEFADYDLRAAVAGPVLRAIFDETIAAAYDSVPGGDDAEDPISRFALFEALSLVHGNDWRRWPADLQDPMSRATRAFAERHADDIRFHRWLQSIANDQIGAAQFQARTAGMALGLYLDVAIGVRLDGADVWAERTAFARGVCLGAPPDRFSPEGQNWTLAPFSPRGLRETGYKPFVDMLRKTMTHAGMIRIDHVLGFRRAFWLPESGVPGAYVDYPLDTLLAITRIEAVRANCLVVGEDLGSVPEGLRDRLAGSGLLGCNVVQFERDGEAFRPPSQYRPNSIASFGTHDLPTLRGWWVGHDLEVRADVEKVAASAMSRATAQRRRERAALVRMLAEEGCTAEAVDPQDRSHDTAERIGVSIHAALAGARSDLVAVQVDDVLGALAQQNLPGTTREHPNWRHKIDADVESMADDPRLLAVAEIMNRARGRDGSPAEAEDLRCS